MSLNFYNSDRWFKCSYAGAPETSRRERPPEILTDSRLEGRAAAWVIDRVIRGDAASAAEMCGETSPDGWNVDEVMTNHCQNYIDLVRRHGTVSSETDVRLWEGLITGRPDQHCVDDPRILRVFEFKYGHRLVEVDQSIQLLLAGVSFFKSHHDLISLELYQPRPYHPAGIHRKWVIAPAELQQHAARIYDRAMATRAPAPVATPGDHCRYCPKLTGCHGAAANVSAMFEIIQDNRRGRKLTAEELAAELRFLTMAQNLVSIRYEGIKAEANARAKTEFIPGYALDKKFGNNAFIVDAATVELMTGIPATKPALKTPAEMIRDGADPAIIEGLSQRPFIGVELKPWEKVKL